MRRTDRLIVGVLAAAVLLVFGRAVFFEFVNWDDNDNLYANIHYRPATWPSLWQFWTTPYKQFYLPVTYSLWWLLAQQATVAVPDELGRTLNPFVFHATNVGLHALNAALAWRLLDRLFDHRWAAAAGALVWALHPLKVEPVAWATGLKDVLGGTFALASMLVFVAYAGASAAKRRTTVGLLVGATLLFVLALLSKTTMVVAAPLAGLLAWWRHPMAWRRVLLGLVPMAAVAAPVVLMTVAVHGASGVRFTYPLRQRPLVVADTLAFYLRKTAWPSGLATLYPRSPARLLATGEWRWTWTIPTGVATAAFVFRRRARWAPLAAGVFVLGVLPASGLVPFNYQVFSTVADRYAYIPVLGLGIAVTGLLAGLRTPWRAAKWWMKATWYAVGLWIAALAVVATVQIGNWRDSESLFLRVLAVTPDDDHTRYQLALLYERLDRPAEAFTQHRLVAAAHPDHVMAHVALARLAIRRRQPEQAQAASAVAQRLLRDDPDRIRKLNAADRVNLGDHLEWAGVIDTLILPQVRTLAPNDDVERRVCYAEILAGARRAPETIALLEEATRLAPNDSQVREALLFVPPFLAPGGATID